MRLRDYQLDILQQVNDCTGHPLVQLDTGAGKTPIIAKLSAGVLRCIVIAHRNELVIQASEKLAACGIEHDTVSSEYTRRRAILRHRRLGHVRAIKRGHSTHIVASLLSLLGLLERDPQALDTAAEWLIIIDEAHHVQPDNMWGSLKTLFPRAKVVGFTGTPARYDGGPLHVDAGGLFTELIQAESLRQDSDRILTDRGYLSDFAAIWPACALPSDQGELAIAGDPVAIYRNKALGRRAIAICASVANARDQAEMFRAAGVSADYIAYDLGVVTVANTLDRFARGEIDVLCAVDMISEGFDMPEAEVLILLARTGSFVRFRQWTGRVRRPKADGRKALIIDLVGLLLEHGMPDTPVIWDIKNPPSMAHKLQQFPCEECETFYHAAKKTCPHCGAKNPFFARPDGVGEFFIKIRRYLDSHLLERMEGELRRQVMDDRQRALDDRMKVEIIVPAALRELRGQDAVSNGVFRLTQWSVDLLRDHGFEIYDINRFLNDPDVQKAGWWFKRFTLADMRHPAGPEKLNKVFAKWQKSR